MIVAGAGSGKTRVLTFRIAHLLKLGADPFSILALTFTNKAAREMRERIEKLVGAEARNLWMGTFHSVFARMLRMECEKIAYPRDFTIYDTDDSKSLIKTIRSGVFDVRVDCDFEAVITACAKTRPDTWINDRIHSLYSELFHLGHVHTVECFYEGRLVGGLYGLALGGVFFGESMFHLMPDASKVALAHLVARLRAGGFILLDTQFVTPHLERMGAVTVERFNYMQGLQSALECEGDFFVWPRDEPDNLRTVLDILQSPWQGDDLFKA